VDGGDASSDAGDGDVGNGGASGRGSGAVAGFDGAGGSDATGDGAGGGTGATAGDGSGADDSAPDAGDAGCSAAQCPASTPVCSTGACRGIKQISVGGLHACALFDDGTVRCWGHNANSQLGLGSASIDLLSRPGPAVVGLTDVEHVASGYEHSCAITRSGALFCWGNNDYGQLGGAQDGKLPVRVAGLEGEGRVAQVECHGDADFLSGFTCARMASGKVFCWGANVNGQLGNDTFDSGPTPTLVKNLTDAFQIALGPHSACAIRSTGSVVCWGYNGAEAPLGTSSTETNLKVPEPVLGLSDVHKIDGGRHYYCAIAGPDDTVKCWGGNERGQIGLPAGGAVTPPFDTNVKPADDVHVGWNSTCALQGGYVECWGDNSLGEFGNGRPGSSPVPNLAAQLEIPTRSFGFRWTTGCALSETGLVQCWGENYYGIIGNGTVGANTATPQFVDWLQAE